MMKCPDYDPGSLSAITDEGVTFRITKIKSHILESFLDNRHFKPGLFSKVFNTITKYLMFKPARRVVWP